VGGPIDPSGRSHRPLWVLPSTLVGGPIDPSGRSHRPFWEIPSTLVGGPIDPCGRSHRPLWEVPSTLVGGPIDPCGRSHTPFWEVPLTLLGDPFEAPPRSKSPIKQLKIRPLNPKPLIGPSSLHRPAPPPSLLVRSRPPLQFPGTKPCPKRKRMTLWMRQVQAWKKGLLQQVFV
jgi:hypothetical protein